MLNFEENNLIPEAEDKHPIIEQMITGLGVIKRPTSKVSHKICKELSILPVFVIEAIKNYGTKILILKKDILPIDSNLFRIRNPEIEYSYRKIVQYKQQMQHILEIADEEFLPVILEQYPVIYKFYKKSNVSIFGLLAKLLSTCEKLEEIMQLHILISEIKGCINFNIIEATSNEIELFIPSIELDNVSDVQNLFYYLTRKYSLNEMSSTHGLRSLKDKNFFFDTTEKLNEDRLDSALRESLRETPALKGKSKYQVPMDANCFPIFVPSYYLFRNIDDNRSVFLDRDIRDNLKNWVSGNNNAFFDVLTKVIFLKEPLITSNDWKKYLDIPHKGSYFVSSPILHELGHAYEYSIAFLYPDVYQDFASKREKAFNAFKDTPHKFISEYASINEMEFTAESFKAYFSRNDNGKLKKLGPLWYKILESFINIPKRYKMEAL